MELIVAVAIMAVIVGAAVPMAGMAINAKAKRATALELDGLAEATLEYFRDVQALPASSAALEVDPGIAGWSGPYVTSRSTDAISGLGDCQVDGWSSAYVFQAGGSSLLTIASYGPDRTPATADDVNEVVDVTPVRRELTLAEIETINTAITQYNKTYLATAPLSTDVPTALQSLSSKGYLPLNSAYQTDAWGDAYQANPVGAAPLVAVGSKNIGLSSGGGGGGGAGSGGGGKGKGKGKGKAKP